MNYNESKISQLILNGLDEMGFVKMTPIQEMAIPELMEGKDIIGQAQTGTGKTVSYTHLFYVIQMMANMGDKLENLKYATIYTLMPGQDILNGTGNVALCCILMIVIWLALYAAGGMIFTKKDLSV